MHLDVEVSYCTYDIIHYINSPPPPPPPTIFVKGTSTWASLSLSHTHIHLPLSVPPLRKTHTISIIRAIESWFIQTPSARVQVWASSSKHFAIDRVAGNAAISTGGSKFMGDLIVASKRLQASHLITYGVRSANYALVCKIVRHAASIVAMQSHLTSLFGGLVVGLTHQPAVLHQVILVACGQLPLAHDAGKAVQVIDEVLRSPHHLCGRNPLLTRCAFGPESPFWEIKTVAINWNER